MIEIIDNYINGHFAIDTPEVDDIYNLLEIKDIQLFDSLVEEIVVPRKKEYDDVISKSQDKTQSLYQIMHDASGAPMAYAARMLKATLNEYKVNHQSDDISKSLWSRYMLEVSLEQKPKSKSNKI